MNQIILKELEATNPILWSMDKNPVNHSELIIVGANKRIQKFVLDLKENELNLMDKTEEIHTKSIRDAKFSPDGLLIAAASFDGTVSIWSHSLQSTSK